ncbi:general secretion pathway protein GspB [Lysobacter sp. LF1]|uniref:General secretion pathway protein GspB n=1 Tax=Lysobacter stagni TaxID=3045172 RepID=A0ABT6XGJ2_9GAMM|nr:general secretion pathway protein GspB [Lysobacter sp. LF1]MDI9239168.1 general secretion pathway protein GspB [Lysobacter sp. LF1]
MSLILDALRKSEAERRRGEVPDLRAELPPLVRASAAPRRLWPAWFAGSALLLAITVLAWSQWASRTVPAAGFAAQPPAVNAEPTPPARSPALVVGAPPPEPVVRRPAPAVPTQVAPAPAPVVVAAPVASLPANAVSPQPSPTAVEMPPPVAPQPTYQAMTSPAGDPVRLSDLSPGEREQLPALKISMHMWGPTPDQRFAIIDGTRVGQGDRVGDAVVQEIAADGVILDWHGRRLSLPLR